MLTAMHYVAEEEGTLMCVAVKEGKFPVLGKDPQDSALDL